MKKTIIIAIYVFLLVGCKTQMLIEINYSDLIGSQEKLINSRISIEIPACKDGENKELDSSSLLQIKQKFDHYFEDSLFVDCIEEGFNSYVYFDMPIGLDLIKNGKPYSDAHLNIISRSEDNLFLSFNTPDRFREKLNKTLQNEFSNPTVEFFIKLIFDKEVEQNFYGYYLKHGSNINELTPSMNFTSDKEKINDLVNQNGVFEYYFKTSDVFSELVLLGRHPTLLIRSKEE